MMGYLDCMKKNKGMNDPECRNLAKSYLACRMDRCVPGVICNGLMLNHGRNLMAKDEFKNLGFGEDKPADDKKDDAADKGKRGELRW